MASKTLWRGWSSRKRSTRVDELDVLLDPEAFEAERAAYAAGEPLVATVMDVQRLGSTHAYPFVVIELRVRVPLVREVPFQVTRLLPVRAGHVPRDGQLVRVVYDPDLPYLVAFETEPGESFREGLPLVAFD